MSGTLLQFASYDNKTAYLIKNPTITFFKEKFLYFEDIQTSTTIYSNSDNKLDFGKSKLFTISKSGDLLNKITMKIVLPEIKLPKYGKFAWVKKIGFALIDYLDIFIDGKKIDTHTGVWFDIHSQLYYKDSIDKLCGNIQELTNYNSLDKHETSIHVPLIFWFNKYQELSFPFSSISSKITFQLTVSKIENLIIRNKYITDDFLSTLNIKECQFIVDNIKIININMKNSEFIIETLTFSQPESLEMSNNYVEIDSKQSIKELIWVLENRNWKNNTFLGYTDSNNWDNELDEIAKKILKRSIYLSDFNTINIPGSWVEVSNISENEKVTVINNSSKYLFLNLSSLISNNTNLTDKISATITVNNTDQIVISNFTHSISVKDISIPLKYMNDTRLPLDYYTDEEIYSLEDVTCNLFSNYSCYIDGSKNPISKSKLVIDGIERITEMSDEYFNIYIPNLYYPGIPDPGINVYPFTCNPEKYTFSKNSDYFSCLNTSNSVAYLLFELSEDVDISTSDIRLYYTNFNLIKIENNQLLISYSSIINK